MTYLDKRSLWRNRRKSGVDGFVYFLRCCGYVKIGFTTRNPERRVYELQSGNPENIELWAYFPGSLSDEQALHGVFSPLLIGREWFACEGRLLDLIWHIEPQNHQRLFDREILENALHDCILSVMPHRDEEELAMATAVPEAWFGAEVA